MNKKYSVLIIAEAANPEWVSVPLVGWSLSSALREVANVHIVTHVRNREAIKKIGLVEGSDFTSIDSEAVARPIWKISSILRGGSGKGWTIVTAFNAISYYYFEYLLWKKFGKDIRGNKYDVVHRITPLSPTTPSLLARKCKQSNVPFVVGPLNGGVSWPKEFSKARREEKEWLSYVRDLYKLLPGYRSTLNNSSAIVVGSRATLANLPAKFHDKCIYLPENGIDPRLFSLTAELKSTGPLKACFVGRLVPYKCPDVLLEAALPLLKKGLLELDIIGDGPLMSKLTDFVHKEKLTSCVTLAGWVKHGCLQEFMVNSQVFAFPSIREFGGGVVLEAMALGLVPLVVDYAGPGELVVEGAGYKVPLGKRDEIVKSLRNQLIWIAENKELLEEVAINAKQRAIKYFAWEAKAAQVNEIYGWVVKQSNEKPSFLEF
ncbi:glycosyltransferase family 4 protein [Desulfogranum mediterraneum]|uniref:glycosyltransferase family 4 protein n=1 Tax=Desulfogranum mediterraneum TaxID=160661 RepID=UPI00040F0B5F|nr:glycosyltransferase family 4 protein [Desulfogranum mediterraneum]